MRVLALNKNGDLTFCEAPIEERGKRRCNHIEHQEILVLLPFHTIELLARNLALYPYPKNRLILNHIGL